MNLVVQLINNTNDNNNNYNDNNNNSCNTKNDIQRGNLLSYNMEGKKAQELSTVTNWSLKVFSSR